MDLLSAARDGFAGIDADPTLKAKALDSLSTWLTHPDYAAYKPQLEKLVRDGKWSVLVDSFYQVIPFGTGGRRGAVGVGPNRMNLWTVGASVQGHCDYLKQRFPDTNPLRVVLAYDVRQFEDKRKVYDPSLPNPVLHLSSREFCQYACGSVRGQRRPRPHPPAGQQAVSCRRPSCRSASATYTPTAG